MFSWRKVLGPGAVAMLITAVGCGEDASTDPLGLSQRPHQISTAGKPLIDVSTQTFDFTSTCPNFIVRTSGYVRIRTIRFTDSDGGIVGAIHHILFKATLVNTETGKAIRDFSQYSMHIDSATGLVSTTGAVFHIVEPGKGIVIHETGKIVFDLSGNIVFEAGPHDVSHGAVIDFCALLNES